MYYTCDSQSSGTTSDSSGNGLTGTLNGTVTDVAGHIGNALLLGTSGSSISCTLTGLITNIWTFACWCHTPATFTTNNLFETYHSGSDEWSIYFSSDGVLHLYNSYGDSMSGASLSTDTTYHILIAYDGAVGCTIYVNGSVYQDATFSRVTVWTDGIIYWGADWSNSSGFRGWLDEIRLYNRRLTIDDAAALYAYTGSSPTPTFNRANTFFFG